MSDYKIKVTFANNSKRVLKDVARLSMADFRRVVRLVSQDGKVLDGRIAGFDGKVIALRTNNLIHMEIEVAKIIGWCYKYPNKTSKQKRQ